MVFEVHFVNIDRNINNLFVWRTVTSTLVYLAEIYGPGCHQCKWTIFVQNNINLGIFIEDVSYLFEEKNNTDLGTKIADVSYV